ncbi:excinuclease ABC subunit B [Cephaloticoccus primus]|uniref:Excinuclease ABC subunit B n=1 Tax=Cephaloticoccus primus TaxID=1548207 RepID=A0A139SNC7_9BACT|nr:UvrB/UvrC motif-containing protein [Cephaloticoccus primus]KXU36000.1 excinuclease ABC subunit B [Cephaloticoccus primus]
MAPPLKCDLCDNPATVHLTQIVNNKVHKVDLCEHCAKAKGVTDPSGFSLSELLLGAAAGNAVAAAAQPPPHTLRCEKCGYTELEFKKSGHLGCPDCYDTFEPLIEGMLDKMHKGTAHLGKAPQRAIERQRLHQRLTELNDALSEAIKTERYEDAARCRDEINQVKQTYGEEPAR